MKSDYRILLFCLLLLCAIAGIFYAVDTEVSGVEAVNVDSISVESQYASPSGEGVNDVSLSAFDPNTADSTTLLRLGLQPWMVRGILKYRAKGGVYSNPEDFARVPGLTVGKYKQLLPYITIGEDFREARTLVHNRGYNNEDYPQEVRDTVLRPKKMTPSERLALNTADTTSLKKVPGVGSYFAKRIVDYRNRLGGFVSLDQLLEIKDFPEAALQYLTIPDGGIRKINVNKADFKQLSAHPYIGYSRTKAIVDYRRLKGRITSLSQLSLLKGFSPEEIAKIEPYIEY